MTHSIGINASEEKIYPLMKTLEFFTAMETVDSLAKNQIEQNYTNAQYSTIEFSTTELKEAGMLASAKNALKKNYLNMEIKYLPIDTTKRERVKMYSLNDAGRKFYNNGYLE